MRWTRTLFWKWTDIVKDPIVDVTKGVAPSTKKYANLPESYIKRAMRQVHIIHIRCLQHNELNNSIFTTRLNTKRPGIIHDFYRKPLNDVNSVSE